MGQSLVLPPLPLPFGRVPVWRGVGVERVALGREVVVLRVVEDGLEVELDERVVDGAGACVVVGAGAWVVVGAGGGV